MSRCKVAVKFLGVKIKDDKASYMVKIYQMMKLKKEDEDTDDEECVFSSEEEEEDDE